MNDLPTSQVSLNDKETHVWRISVDQVPTAHGRDLLDPDEWSRINRFRCAADRARYLAAHVALRSILRGYLGIDPARIRFCTNGYGKPFVADQPVEFSLSHSGEVILIAIARDGPIGIDVERIRAEFDFQAVLDRFFSAHERAEVLGRPQGTQSQLFFSIWTRKEAVLKMTGRGLSGLGRPELRATGTGECAVRPIDVGAGYSAALATEKDSAIRVWWLAKTVPDAFSGRSDGPIAPVT